jgi:hypothetical protein
MRNSITVLTPVPEARSVTAAGRPLPSSVHGKTVGFLDNTKANFAEFARQLGEVLVGEYGARRVIIRRKPNAAIPAPDPVLAGLAKDCDVVFTGSGD